MSFFRADREITAVENLRSDARPVLELKVDEIWLPVFDFVVRMVRNIEVEVALENAGTSIALSKQNLAVHRECGQLKWELEILPASFKTKKNPANKPNNQRCGKEDQ